VRTKEEEEKRRTGRERVQLSRWLSSPFPKERGEKKQLSIPFQLLLFGESKKGKNKRGKNQSNTKGSFKSITGSRSEEKRSLRKETKSPRTTTLRGEEESELDVKRKGFKKSEKQALPLKAEQRGEKRFSPVRNR